MAADLPVKSVLGFETPKVLAVALLVLICFFAGLFARTIVARKLINWLEASFLSNLPGYESMKGIGEGLLGIESKWTNEVVLVRFEDDWRLAFLIERIDTGHFAVFVPDAPNPHSGSLCFMAKNRVKSTGIRPQDALKCIKRLGVGSNALFKSELAPPETESAKAK
ncbi:MAG TPA: DUF502 domain-containing protein [Verrucomicrobiae bacterium]|nr:DUF502 domain-containing protein [Verrucomicrobiae bacterium]